MPFEVGQYAGVEAAVGGCNTRIVLRLRIDFPGEPFIRPTLSSSSFPALQMNTFIS